MVVMAQVGEFVLIVNAVELVLNGKLVRGYGSVQTISEDDCVNECDEHK
jgi:hypothetical protein